MTAAALVFCPSSRDPSAPNLTPPPLMLSPVGTSTVSAARRIESDVNGPETFGSTSCISVQPPTNPATAGMSRVCPVSASSARAFTSNDRPAADRAAGLISPSGLSAAYTPTDPDPTRRLNSSIQNAELVPIAALNDTWLRRRACQIATPSSIAHVPQEIG